jgi:hypothetical protein
MPKRPPGLLSLLTRAAWSVRLKLVATALLLLGFGFGAGWTYRWFTEPRGSATAPAAVGTTVASESRPTPGTPAIPPYTEKGTLYVLNGGGNGSITEYPAGTSGDAEPSAIISGELTGLSNYPRGMALDRAETSTSQPQTRYSSSKQILPAMLLRSQSSTAQPRGSAM